MCRGRKLFLKKTGGNVKYKVLVLLENLMSLKAKSSICLDLYQNIFGHITRSNPCSPSSDSFFSFRYFPKIPVILQAPKRILWVVRFSLRPKVYQEVFQF